MPPEENKSKKNNRLAAIFIMAAVLVFLWAFLGERDKTTNKNEIRRLTVDGSSPHEKRVNTFLREIENRRQLTQDKTRLENYFTAPKIGSTVAVEPVSSEMHPFRMKPEGLEDQVSRDLDARVAQRQQEESAQAQVQEELAQRQKQFEQDQAYREAYVKAFIENAKRNGYLIKVNDDLVVTSVTRIQGFRQSASDEGGEVDDSGAQ